MNFIADFASGIEVLLSLVDSDKILVGVIDNIRPEQYGRSLPPQNEILIGEISIIFTEALDCAFLQPFDVTLTVLEMDGYHDNKLVLDKSSLQTIIWEGRKIGLQVDLHWVDPTILLGKSFHVKIDKIGGESVSQVMDETEIKWRLIPSFRGLFANLDMNEASITFRLILETDCSDANDSQGDIIEMITDAVGISDASRVTLTEM